MATWLGEIRCLNCGHWQIPMAYCPKCGHKWQPFVVVDADLQWSYTVAPANIQPGTAGVMIE